MTPPIFGHGELRLVLLTLIAERPRHGYELIQALSEHFAGSYSPSAGTIYPRLAKLESERLVTKREDGRKTVYAITAAGQREVDERRSEFEQITVDQTASLRSVAEEARSGLAQARSGLRAELDRIAASARAAAEAAMTGHAAAMPDPAAEATDPAEAAPESPRHEGGCNFGGVPPVASVSPETEQGLSHLRRVDVALQRLRMDVRQDARTAEQNGTLDGDALDDVERELFEVRRRIAGRFGIHY
ncbi:PadR family transcriptional regulator [Gulosibacter macacae]|uniref:PadR family transcriptional regulator n=1 Tax=Gulosibacter macacae TaxID=2488791 RepID=A0A3P3VXG9_9MICO|nr:PadR family transcriptional regulator [Gulosibacter macacae]RRJ87047.1 PadR family transcriptional regulator [Gulosibacter macacae]